MRRLITFVLLACAFLHADDAVVNQPSKQDIKEARQAFERGLKLQSDKHLDEAYEQFQRAATLVPRDSEYVATREVVRQQLVFLHIAQGNHFLEQQQPLAALAEFRLALTIDPYNQYAQQQVQQALAPATPKPSPRLETLASADTLELHPATGRTDFHLNADARSVIQQVAQRFGIKVQFDDSVQSRPLRFDLGDADFATAMRMATLMTHAFYVPLSEKEVLVAADTPDNHRQFDRMVLRTYYVSGANTPGDVNDIVNLLRNIFEVRFISAEPSKFTITVRAPEPMLHAAEEFVREGAAGRPQVALDIKVYEVNRQFLRNFGLNLPTQIQMFNIPAAALQLLQQPNIQQLINQLIASGGINQAGSQAIAALLAQLQNQQNSLLGKPIATFGGGLTFFGVIIPAVTASFYDSDARIATLEHATLRSADLAPLTFRVGERFPILNASFSPILNSSALSQVIGNNSFRSPFPSFNFEDLGLTLKTTPHVHAEESIGLDMEVQIQSLAPQSFNGIPELNHREYKGWITLKDGETAVIASDLTEDDERSLSALPGLQAIPVLSNRTHQLQETELLITVTPHLIRAPHNGQPAGEVWLQQ